MAIETSISIDVRSSYQNPRMDFHHRGFFIWRSSRAVAEGEILRKTKG